MPTIRLLRPDRRKPESNYLAGFARTVTSQHGEDGILEKIFELIGADSRWCVEFGAWDGKTHSNTWNLIANEGWSSVQIEGNGRRYQQLLQTHGGNPAVHCLHSLVGFDPRADSLDHWLSTTPIPKVFDFLSIDIDGNDYWIWHSMSRYRARVVMVEFNPVVSSDVVFIQDRDFTINQGASLRAFVELAKKRGYQLSCVSRANAIFVRDEDFPALNIADNDIDAMFQSHRDGRFWYALDGTIFNVGISEMHLRRRDVTKRTIDPMAFQVYSEAERGYGGAVPTDFQPPVR